jgi:hypothetical protein
LQVFDRQVNAAEVERLLTTAVARMHSAVVEQLCTLPAAKQVPGNGIMQLLQLCIVHQSPVPCVLFTLLNLASDKLSADAAAALAATFGSPPPMTSTVSQLPCFPAPSSELLQTQQYPQQTQLYLAEPPVICSLLKTAIQHGNTPAILQLMVLWKLVPADSTWLGLAHGTLADLLCEAVQMQEGSTALAALCSDLPGMQDLPAEQLVPVLLLAVQLQNHIAAQQLLQLPGAAGLNTASALAVLRAAVQRQAGEQLVRSLLALPASRDIDSDSAAFLMMSSMYDGPDFQVLSALLQSLPSAALMPSERFRQVLGVAVHETSNDREGRTQVLQQLVKLAPAAESLNALQVMEVFLAAVQLNKSDAWGWLCELPAAAQLSPDQLFGLLQQAIQHNSSNAAEAVWVLCYQLAPVTLQLQQQQVYSVALAVAKLAGGKEGATADSFHALDVFHQLPAVQAISATQVAELALANLKIQVLTEEALLMLLFRLGSLPSAQQLAQHQLKALLGAAVASDMYECAVLLQQLPAAQALQAEDVLQLLLVTLLRIDTPLKMRAADGLCMALLRLPGMVQCAGDGLYSVMHNVVRLPPRLQSHGSLTGDFVEEVVKRQIAWLQLLMQSPAAGQIEAYLGAQLLQYALQQQPAAAKVLCCMLPAVQQLDAAGIRDLLTMAIGRPEQAMQQTGSSSSDSAVGCLCALPGAQQLQPLDLQVLLKTALLQDRATAVECLASIEGPAAGIEREALLELLRTAVSTKSGTVSIISSCCATAVQLDTCDKRCQHAPSWSSQCDANSVGVLQSRSSLCMLQSYG